MAFIHDIVEAQRSYFASGATRSLAFRLEMLKRLKKAVRENEAYIAKALREDLNKPAFEAYATETGIVLEEIKYIIRRLPHWVKPKRVRTPIVHALSASKIYPEPYGVALVMSPWNYPIQLSLNPLIGSVAAGNCTVLKPSAYTPKASALLAKMLGDIFDKRFVAVVEGGRQENKALLEEKFDYIFFTGSVEVGKNIMEAASRHLTPVTLELGGKSPCIVDDTANLELAARRIVWGKFLNAGQTCVAPDYLLVHEKVKEPLLHRMKQAIAEFYGEHPEQNPDFPRIVNEKHFSRLKGLMTQGRIVAGGRDNPATLQIAPTIIADVRWEDPVMQEEIFGPILPVLEFGSLDEIIEKVNGRPKPLAAYLFSTNKTNTGKLLNSIPFGGGCINDTVVHLGTSHMPFGGVGESGMGGYHGKASFDSFSHKKSILKKSNLFDIKLRYPPYGNKLELLKKLMR